MQPKAALEFYEIQQDISKATADEIRRVWRRHMLDEKGPSAWRKARPIILEILAEGQRQAGRKASEYLPKALEQQGIPDQPLGTPRPEKLVGVAADGRNLGTLVDQAVVKVADGLEEGLTAAKANENAAQWLHLVARQQVNDLARVSTGLGMASQRSVGGHVRVLNPPVCQRCAILGGRVYRWSKGFDRHPGDDCTMLPVKDADAAVIGGYLFDPDEAYRRGDIHDLTQAQIDAIEEGADLGKVVNAYRGMSTTATQEILPPANIPHGKRRYLGNTIPRPTPEGIYIASGGDRDKAVQLLREHGFFG